jgi:hypothetical protein
MKRLSFIIGTLLISFFHSYAQDRVYKPFKVDCGFTIDVPTNDNASTGGGFYIEPRYSVNDRLTIGLRVEGIYLSAGDITINYTSVKINSTIVSPILLTGDYYFSSEKVRPFIGIGVGMYKKTLHTVGVSVEGIDIGPKTNTYFGFAPRIGINAGHFRLAALYNYPGKDIGGFLGIQVGFEFGGGRINP